MLNFPVSYILLRNGMQPEIVFIVSIVISQCCLAARLFMLRVMIALSVRKYLKKVYINVLAVTAMASVFPFLLTNEMEDSSMKFVFLSLIAVVSTGFSIYYIGCNNAERQFVLSKLHAVKNKLDGK